MSKKCNFTAMSTERVGIEGYGIFVLVALYYGNQEPITWAPVETNQSNVSEGT